ncbi:chorismate--pyruvate lyase [bacterium D16-54]|nr:chorismate--pyruvate lyase [bacterium D16-54]RKJ16288.1 chorismate--pyruvate lyase [bacterium D16-56]
MGPFEYIIEQIDGDYAQLRRTDEPDQERKLVARALLPENIEEGMRLRYEMFEYTILQLQ